MTFIEFVTTIAPLVYFIGGSLFILAGFRAVGELLIDYYLKRIKEEASGEKDSNR